jgi:hypothetical protein
MPAFDPFFLASNQLGAARIRLHARQMLELQAIEVSTRSALREESGDVERIRENTAHLLDRLEAGAVRDGCETTFLSTVARVRGELLEQP